MRETVLHNKQGETLTIVLNGYGNFVVIYQDSEGREHSRSILGQRERDTEEEINHERVD